MKNPVICAEDLQKLFPSIFTQEERGEGPKRTKGPQEESVCEIQRTVEYVHPKGRFVTVRFTFTHGLSFCESVLLDRNGRVKV